MKLFLRTILLFAVASFVPLAFGAPDWTNEGPDNNFDNPDNWIATSGAGAVPGAGDSAHIFPGFIVTTGLFVNPGGNTTITINAGNNESVESLLVSSDFDELNLITVTNGILNLTVPGTLSVGVDGAADTGVVVTGASTVNFTGNIQQASGTFVVGTTDSFLDTGEVTGAGTFNLTLGSSVNLDSATGSTTLIIGQGAAGSFVQTGSAVTAGPSLLIGSGGGNGTYSLTNGSVLNIGTPGAPNAAAYDVEIGSGGGSTGSLAISHGTLNATNPNTTILLGTGTTATGTITESGSSTVTIDGATLDIGDANGATGTYNLQAGNLTVLNTTANSSVDLGVFANSTGNFVQTGGALSVGATSTFVIGDAGTGNFTITAGTADFGDGFTLGNQAASTGTFTQSGGAVTAEGAVTIGGAGTGTYSLNNGTATFSNGATVGALGMLNVHNGTLSLGANAVNLVVSGGGAVTQTGGTLTIASNQHLNLSAAGSTYNLNGGTLQIGPGGFVVGNGNLNGGGGTIQVTGAGAFVDPYAGSLAAGTVTTINASSGAITSATIARSLSGGGGISFLGAGTATAFGFGSANTYTGSTVIQNGTLTANLNEIGSSTLINIVNANSVLDLSTVNAGVNKFSSVLTGAGTLNVNYATAGATLELANAAANSFSGNIDLGYNGNHGTLQIFNGNFGAINDEIGGAAATTSASGVTIGGDNTVATTGAVNFTQTPTYTGLTTISTGFSLTAPGITGNLVNNGTLGVLSSQALGTTPNFNIGNGATPSNFNSSATSTLIIRSTGLTSDSYQVYGTTTFTAGSSAFISGFGSTPAGGLVVLNSNGLLTGTPTTSIAGAGVLFSGGITKVGNQLVLNTVQLGTAAFAQTPNQRAVAGAVDPALISGNLPLNFGTTFNNLSAAQIPGVLDQLSPEVLQYSRNIAVENSTFLVQHVDGALANVRAGYAGLDTSGFSVVSNGFESGLGRSLGSLLAYNPPSFNQPAPDGVNYYPQPEGYSPYSSSTPVPFSSESESGPASSSRSISDSPNPQTVVPPSSMTPSEPNFGGPVLSEFILGNVVLADMNQNQSAPNAAPAKASYTAGDATAGISFRMTNNLAAGVLFDYNHTDAKTDGNGSKTDVDSYSPGIYATYFNKGFYVNGLFSFGYNTYSNTRAIPFFGATATSSPTGQQYVTNLDGGYDFQPKRHPEWIFGPTLGLTYTHLNIDSFTESGAGPADLAVASQSVDSLRGRLGAHVIYQARSGSILFQPNFTAMWQHEFLNSTGITSQLNIPGTSPFTIQTAGGDKDSALLGCGVTMTLDNSMAFYVNYIADVGTDDFLAQSIVGGFKASF